MRYSQDVDCVCLSKYPPTGSPTHKIAAIPPKRVKPGQSFYLTDSLTLAALYPPASILRCPFVSLISTLCWKHHSLSPSTPKCFSVLSQTDTCDPLGEEGAGGHWKRKVQMCGGRWRFGVEGWGKENKRMRARNGDKWRFSFWRNYLISESFILTWYCPYVDINDVNEIHSISWVPAGR